MHVYMIIIYNSNVTSQSSSLLNLISVCNHVWCHDQQQNSGWEVVSLAHRK